MDERTAQYSAKLYKELDEYAADLRWLREVDARIADIPSRATFQRLPDETSDPTEPLPTLALAEKMAILRALDATNNNIVATAAILDVSRAGLYNKLRAHDIKPVRRMVI